jgi:hypothetical protein
MDVKQKEGAFIEFLLLEGRPDDEIAASLQNVYAQDAYSRVSVFGWIQEVRRGNEEPQNEGRPWRACQHKIDAAIRSIPQDDPNALLRTIGETLSVSPETVRTHVARIGVP